MLVEEAIVIQLHSGNVNRDVELKLSPMRRPVLANNEEPRIIIICIYNSVLRVYIVSNLYVHFSCGLSDYLVDEGPG